MNGIAVGAIALALVAVAALAIVGAALRRTRQRANRFQALIEVGNDKFIIIDVAGVVVYVSPGARHIFGVEDHASMLGPFSLERVHPDDSAALADALAWCRANPARPMHLECRVRHRDGSWRVVEATYLNLLDDPGVRGIVGIDHDITPRRTAEVLVRREADLNALALEVSRHLASTDVLRSDNGAPGMFQRIAGHFAADLAWIEVADRRGRLVHRFGWAAGAAVDERIVPAEPGLPVDGDEIVRIEEGEGGRAPWASSSARLTDRGCSTALVAPIHSPDTRVGSVTLGRHRAEPFDDVHEAQLLVLARLAVQWVQHVHAEADRAAADRRAGLLATYVREAVVTVDLQGNVTWASPAAVLAAGLPARDLPGRPVADFIHAEDLGHALDNAADVVAGGAVRPFPARLMTTDGGVRWAEVTVELARVGDGDPDELVVVVRDVHEHHVRAEALAVQAVTDPLTGAVNRSGLLDALHRLCQGVSVRPFAVAFCDLDGFKEVNDRFGHRAGDEALQAVAERLRAALRPLDLVARFGGDEFVLLLREVDEPTAAQVCRRVIESVAEPLAVGEEAMRLTISVGMIMAAPGDEAVQLIGSADAAMYEAKRAGKDQLVIGTRLPLDDG